MSPSKRFAELAARLRPFLEQLQRETAVPGIGAAVSVGGERIVAAAGTLAAGSQAPLTAGARFELGCIMKLLLALAALELTRRGAVDLDAPIARYLPELRAAERRRNIRVRHLLSHTSGYQGTDVLDPAARSLDWSKFVAYLHAAPQFFEAGTVFNYEHSEAVLLERVLERAAGSASLALVRRIVLEPLRCSAPIPARECAADVRVVNHRFDGRLHRFEPEHTREPGPFWSAAFSSHTLTLPDLLGVAEALAGSNEAAAGGLASASLRAARQEAVRLPFMVGGPLQELLPTAFGLGTAILRGGYYGSTGISRGQCVGLRFEPKARVAVAVGLNAFVPHLRDLILATICASLGSSPSSDAPFPEISLEELEGDYRGGGRKFLRAAYSGGRLRCELGYEGVSHPLPAELAVADDGRWVLRSPAPQLALGALREPGSGAPVLMAGLSAFKRMAEREPPAGH